jgi:hypothetical protein
MKIVTILAIAATLFFVATKVMHLDPKITIINLINNLKGYVA